MPLSLDTNETGVTDKRIHQKKRGALCQPSANNKRGLGESFLKQESGIVQLQGDHIQLSRDGRGGFLRSKKYDKIEVFGSGTA